MTEVDNLVFNAIILVIVITIVDNAFNYDFRGVEDLFWKRVWPPRHSLYLKWKKSKLKTPIFCQAVLSAEGIRTSPNKAL